MIITNKKYICKNKEEFYKLYDLMLKIPNTVDTIECYTEDDFDEELEYVFTINNLPLLMIDENSKNQKFISYCYTSIRKGVPTCMCNNDMNCMNYMYLNFKDIYRKSKLERILK